MNGVAPERMDVLYVDGDPEAADEAASLIELEDDRLSVETATSADEALERLSEREVDCVVSEYDVPAADGLALLEAIREEDPDLPFVLFTGEGSEAISAGITDYFRKGARSVPSSSPFSSPSSGRSSGCCTSARVTWRCRSSSTGSTTPSCWDSRTSARSPGESRRWTDAGITPEGDDHVQGGSSNA